MRKLSNARGIEIIRQGAQQYMAMFEQSANPFKAGTVENKLWDKGWLEARFKWEKPFLDRKKFAARKFVKRPFVKPSSKT